MSNARDLPNDREVLRLILSSLEGNLDFLSRAHTIQSERLGVFRRLHADSASAQQEVERAAALRRASLKLLEDGTPQFSLIVPYLGSAERAAVRRYEDARLRLHDFSDRQAWSRALKDSLAAIHAILSSFSALQHRVLQGLTESNEERPGRDSNRDNEKTSRVLRRPENGKVATLARRIARAEEAGEKLSKIDLAKEIAATEQEAKNILRQYYRPEFKHLRSERRRD